MTAPEDSADAAAFAEATRVMDRHLNALRDLDSRSTTLMVISAALLGLTLSAVATTGTTALAEHDGRPDWVGAVLLALLVAGSILLVLTMTLCIRAQSDRRLAVGLKIDGLARLAGGALLLKDFLVGGLNAYTEGIRTNQRISEEMARNLAWARFTLAVGLQATLVGIVTLISMPSA